MMQFNGIVRVLPVLCGLIVNSCFGLFSCTNQPAKFDDFVQSFDESRKYRINSFIVSDSQGDASRNVPSMSSTVLRSPDRAFLLIQKSRYVNITVCEFYTLLKDQNGTLKGHYGEHDRGNGFSDRVHGFELEKAASSLILRICLSNNVIHRYEFDLNAASSLEEGDFRGDNPFPKCNLEQFRRVLRASKPGDIRMVFILGLIGVFFCIQIGIACNFAKIFDKKTVVS